MAKSEELQCNTQRVLTELGAPGKALSARSAGDRLNIGYNQIADMVKGKSPAEKTLIKFASAIGESPADWLRYAGKHEFANTLGKQAQDEASQEQKFADQIARDLMRVPKDRRALVLRQVRALIRASENDDNK